MATKWLSEVIFTIIFCHLVVYLCLLAVPSACFHVKERVGGKNLNMSSLLQDSWLSIDEAKKRTIF